MFLESAAALSLIVAGALQPTRVGGPPAPAAPAPTPDAPPAGEAAPASRQPRRRADRQPGGRADNDQDRGDDPPPPPPPRKGGKRGRPATVLPSEALDRIRRAGGEAGGSLNGVAKLIGAGSKTAAHRLLHRMATAGVVQLDTGPHGVRVAVV